VSRVVDAVKGSDEGFDARGVTAGEVAVHELEHLAGAAGIVRIEVGDAMCDGHHDGRRSAMAADVGDENAPFVIGQGEEVVIVAAGAGGGAIVSGEVQGGDRGRFAGEE
jgi:hypothetical protein